MKNFIYFLMAVLFLASCKDDDDFIDLVTDRDWEVVELQVENFTGEAPSTYILDFSTKNNFTINFDINQCEGNYAINNNGEVDFDSIGCTEICCDSMFAQHAKAFLNLATSWEVTEGQLFLYRDSTFMRLIQVN